MHQVDRDGSGTIEFTELALKPSVATDTRSDTVTYASQPGAALFVQARCCFQNTYGW